jgi:C-terminal peptidase prc
VNRIATTALAIVLAFQSIAAGECRALRLPPPVLSYERRPVAVFRDILDAIDARRPGSLEPEAIATQFLVCLDTLTELPIERDGSTVRVAAQQIPLDGNRPIDRAAKRFNRRISKAMRSAATPADAYEIADVMWYVWIEAVLSLGHRFDGYTYANDVVFQDAYDRGRAFAVGFRLRREDRGWVVSRLDDESLAAAGVSVGDGLVAIDGVLFSELTDIDRTRLWFAPSPFDYRATFDRDGETVSVDAIATPRRLDTVDIARIDRIGYVRIHRFARETRIELRRALRELAQSTALILDLRSNSGGALDVGLIDIFFPPDRILLTSRPYGSSGDVDHRRGSIEYEDRPLAVLIDRNSASMSEALAAAIRKHDRGILVGETTFGKGVSQTQIDIGDDGRLTLVDTEYFFPGTTDTWHEIGVPPHHEVTITEEERERLSESLRGAAAGLHPDGDRVLAVAVELLGKDQR